jgi:integrase/recombinase XerD
MPVAMPLNAPELKKSLRPHTLRHYAACGIGDTVSPPILWKGGADLPTVQALLGHVDLKPTSIYLHLSERHLRAAGTPLDNAELSSLDQVKRSRRLHKR